MKNIVFTYREKGISTLFMDIMPMDFEIKIDYFSDEDCDLIVLDINSTSTKANAYSCISIAKENTWPLQIKEWWDGTDRHNICGEIMEIVSSSLAEHISGNSDTFGDHPFEINLNEFQAYWETEINAMLKKIKDYEKDYNERPKNPDKTDLSELLSKKK